jgi:NAD+ kinase
VSRFQRIAIDPNLAKPGCDDAVRRLVSWLTDQNRIVLVPPHVLPVPPKAEVRERQDLAADSDLVIVLGGDGTLLSTARRVYPRRVPILGVNFGGLGFLTDLSVEGMIPGLERIFADEYRSESRIMLKASIITPQGTSRDRRFALNDIVMHEVGHRLLTLLPTLDSTEMGEFHADGLIIATPTGSTAYSLSSGGPIVEPTLRALIATPICPHVLSMRPIVFPSDQTLTVRFPPSEARVQLVADGQEDITLQAGEVVSIRRAEGSVEFLRTKQETFYDVLRTKLKWGS